LSTARGDALARFGGQERQNRAEIVFGALDLRRASIRAQIANEMDRVPLYIVGHGNYCRPRMTRCEGGARAMPRLVRSG